jgi:peptidoglycan/xylan/chitin deacetylase (PgdA/CDA1 family)
LRDLVAGLQKLEPSRRLELLNGLEDVLADGIRYMVTPAQLRTLQSGGVAIGAHGQSHEPLTGTDTARELVEVREILARHVETAPVLSFPHGRFDGRVVEQAFGAGYRLLFTSVPELSRRDARGPGLLGRVGFTTETITEGGRFAPEKLALHLFRKPHAA